MARTKIGKKGKSGGKICPEGKAWARRTFDTNPSAYANSYAVRVCKGQVKAGGKKKAAPGYSKRKRVK